MSDLLREISHNPGRYIKEGDWIDGCNRWPPVNPPHAQIKQVAHWAGRMWSDFSHCDNCPHKHNCTSSYTDEAIGCSVGREG